MNDEESQILDRYWAHACYKNHHPAPLITYDKVGETVGEVVGSVVGLEVGDTVGKEAEVRGNPKQKRVRPY